MLSNLLVGAASRRSAAIVLAVGTTLISGTSRARNNAAGHAAETAAIEALLDRTATAFIGMDSVLIKQAFVENFAGPFRLPRLAQTTLDRVMQAAESVAASYEMSPLDVVEGRAAGIVQISLAFGFRGGAKREHSAEYLMFFRKEDRQWLIEGAEPLTAEWQLDPTAEGMVIWDDESMRFPAPAKWEGYPLATKEARKGIVFVSPDLKATLGVAVVGLPAPVDLTVVVANQKGVPQLYPGSRFVGEEQTRMAGEPAVVTRIDLKLGKSITRVVSRMMIRGDALYMVNLAVMPAEDVNAYLPVYAATVKGLQLGAAQEPADEGVTDFVDATTGFSVSAPEGWSIHDSSALAKKSGWMFAATAKPASGTNYVIFGARDLGQAIAPQDLAKLQEAELGNIRAIAKDLEVHEQGDIKIGERPARSWICSFTIGQKRKRREVFMVEGKRLFFVVADAVPASGYAKVADDIDKLIQSIIIGK